MEGEGGGGGVQAVCVLGGGVSQGKGATDMQSGKSII